MSADSSRGVQPTIAARRSRSARISARAGVLYGDWRGWCERGGMAAWSIKAFSQGLGERGFRRVRRADGAGFVGLGLAGGPPRGVADVPVLEDLS
jgi:hypothetical protein